MAGASKWGQTARIGGVDFVIGTDGAICKRNASGPPVACVAENP